MAEREPEAAAGHGPRVAALGAERDQLRQRIEVPGRVEEFQRRWHAVDRQVGDPAERAAHAEVDAERTRRWHSG